VLPEPQGPNAVGTFVAHLVDYKRHERHAAGVDVHRELMIQVWYPAKRLAGIRAWYRDPLMNTWRSNHLHLVKTHSYWNLPPAAEPRTFPVLLFSPSSGGNRDQNTFEVEELASEGYVVVGMDHPYSSSRVVFPDGRVVHSLPWLDSSTQATWNASLANVELMVQDHVSDASFVLDEMERWNQAGSNHLLSARLDLSKVGVFGHSFGGALAASLCDADPRVVACINMDGWIFGPPVRMGIPKPYFFMESGNGAAPDAARIATLAGSERIEGEKDLVDWRATQASFHQYGGYQLTILGSEHGDYSDLVLFTRPLPFGKAGGIDPYRAFAIVNAFTIAFFEHYLRSKAAPLLDRGGFPNEVEYTIHLPPKAATAKSDR
jgi:pimeloyl-ACP methyl ester carboxylesterase